MAAPAVLPAMNGDKTLHPFFRKIDGDDNTHTHPVDEPAVEQVDGLDGAQDSSRKLKGSGKGRKPRASAQTNGKTQKTLQELVKPVASITNDSDQGDAQTVAEPCSDSLVAFDATVNTPRRKRRRTSRTESVEVGDEGEDEDDNSVVGKGGALDATRQKQASPRVVIPISSPLPQQATLAAPKTPPKKMLRLNASGKFSSPVSKKPDDGDQSTEMVQKRIRPRKAKEAPKPNSLLVIFKYTAEKSHVIDRILTGEERYIKEVKTATPKKQRTPRKKPPPKPTHPLFLGKPKEPPPPKQASPRKTSAVTPGKLKRQTMASSRMDAVLEAHDIWTSALLKDRQMMKHPGAKEAAWPDRDQTHVRGLGARRKSDVALPLRHTAAQERKRKTARKPVPPDESLLSSFASQLTPEEDGEIRSDGFRDPHPSLRLPKKLLISGAVIAQRVGRGLSARILDDNEDEDEPVLPRASHATVHPALQKLYTSLPCSLSAYDEGRGESFSWTQKYAPSTAVEVLQPSREMGVLKDWLVSLTITAVESKSKAESKSYTKAEPKPKKKRRRKNDDDLDDFLVDSDEDLHEMDDLANSEDPIFASACKAARSIVQVASEGVKLSNAVLLSGPHGCGKTAAAYAVAKELGFRVFEISPCDRRSGKDVVDKVGDMTENHLVKHHGTDASIGGSTVEEPGRFDEALQRDLASGRQGKMNAFFKPKPQVNAKQPTLKKKQLDVVKAKTLEAVQKVIKKPPKDQQQSLVLLEEVDILFKDDKEFWSTVLKLIATSKRPFIMTCNDEDLVPLQAMSLHAILRFSPPTKDLATDYLLLVAAAGGHLLNRKAVSSLYESKDHDLRAAIAELDFWCQMGVGDPRTGLSWMYQRYPPGSDLDSHGRKLRVVSKGTYQIAMGRSCNADLDTDSQLLWAWHELDTSPVTLLGWQTLPSSQSTQLPTLKSYASFTDSLSAQDVYAGASKEALLDTTQKDMPDTARSQYIEGLPLLQTDEYPDYSGLSSELAVASALSSYRDAGLLATSNVGDLLMKRPQSEIKGNGEDASILTRHDFACFDAISLSTESALSAGSGLAQSAFDGPLEPIATDLAPYVRSIVQYDLALAEQRERLNNLMGEGRNAKRARTTRAARSALEGSQRASTRREKWFPKELDFDAVLATAGERWPKTTVVDLAEAGSRNASEAPCSGADSTEPS